MSDFFKAMRWFVATAVLKKSVRPNGFQMKIIITHIMLLRLAAAMRRFFKFSHKKNRLKISKCALPADGLDGKEKISEGDKCEPKGSQKNCEIETAESIIIHSNINGVQIQAIKPITIFSNLVANLSLK